MREIGIFICLLGSAIMAFGLSSFFEDAWFRYADRPLEAVLVLIIGMQFLLGSTLIFMLHTIHEKVKQVLENHTFR